MTKSFARFARKAGLEAANLRSAAEDVADGRFDADLGNGVFKQRIARQGGGKSGGFRTLILFRDGRHAFFAHGFAKNEKANVTAKELTALKKLADLVLAMPEADIRKAIKAGEFVEVNDDGGESKEG